MLNLFLYFLISVIYLILITDTMANFNIDPYTNQISQAGTSVTNMNSSAPTSTQITLDNTLALQIVNSITQNSEQITDDIQILAILPPNKDKSIKQTIYTCSICKKRLGIQRSRHIRHFRSEHKELEVRPYSLPVNIKFIHIESYKKLEKQKYKIPKNNSSTQIMFHTQPIFPITPNPPIPKPISYNLRKKNKYLCNLCTYTNENFNNYFIIMHLKIKHKIINCKNFNSYFHKQ